MARVGVIRRRFSSREFRKKFNSYSKQAYQGPPEKNSDYIYAAALALQKGDWSVAWKHIDSLPVWSVIPNRKVVKEKLKAQVQEVALETFLISFGPQLSSISFNRLLEFGLPRKTTYKVASKLIFDDHLQGAWDQANDCLIIHAVEATPLQAEALTYVEKVNSFLDQNVRLCELYSSGGYHRYNSSWNNRGSYNRGWGGGGGGRGGRGYNSNRGGYNNRRR